MTPDLQAIHDVIASIFKDDDGGPLDFTAGQCEIVRAILDRNLPRVWIGTTTQYGKSLSISVALQLARKSSQKIEKILVIAPSKAQSKIIMNYILGHVTDHPYLFAGLIESSKIERLKTEMTKERLAWQDGSSISVLSAEAGSNSGDINKAGKSIMGFGGSIIVVDEAALIPDMIMGKILRMLGGHTDAKLVLVGNPFNKNYFYKAFQKPLYHKILIDYKRAIAEGRLTQSFIDEMREDLDVDLFSVLYEVKFVTGDRDSYIQQEDFDFGREQLRINLESELWVKERESAAIKVGVDVARSIKKGDESAIYIRKGHVELHAKTYKTDDTNALGGELIMLKEKFGFDWSNVTIDSIGVGAGLVDFMRAEGRSVVGLNWAIPADKRHAGKYYNMRMQLWAAVKDAVRSGDLDTTNPQLIDQLKVPRSQFRALRTGAVRKLESKEDLRKRGEKSPDIADACALSYYVGKKFYIGTF